MKLLERFYWHHNIAQFDDLCKTLPAMIFRRKGNLEFQLEKCIFASQQK